MGCVPLVLSVIQCKGLPLRIIGFQRKVYSTTMLFTVFTNDRGRVLRRTSFVARSVNDVGG